MPNQIILINVTQQDIEGASLSQGNDPIVRAIQRILGSTWTVYISVGVVETVWPHRVVILPAAACMERDKYLKRQTIAPFDFGLS